MAIEFAAGVQGHTFVSANLARTEQFMTGLLGLSVVKRTVHPGDARIPVLIFGFGETPESGALVTYMEWSPIFYAFPPDGLLDVARARGAVDAPRVGDFRGSWGAGTNHHLALHVGDRSGLLRWKRWLSDAGVHVTGPYFRNYFHAVYFRDPDGAILEIATTEPGFGHDEEVLGSGHRAAPAEAMVGARSEEETSAETWPEAVAVLAPDMRLQGLHHITSVSSDIERTTRFWVDHVGIDLIKRTDYLDAVGATHYYFSADANGPSPGTVITYFGFPGFRRGRLGVGLAHHFSLRATDEGALESWREHLRAGGVPVGEIVHGRYGASVGFQDPDGHLCELACPPRLAVDEPSDQLGRRLCLGPELEAERDRIERTIALRPAPAPQAPAPVPAASGAPG
ncbi:MAG: VOC family protein [Solirubrobacteraceae bacterium]